MCILTYMGGFVYFRAILELKDLEDFRVLMDAMELR